MRTAEELEAEVEALRAALAGAREHNQILEGQVCRLVEENVMLRRELDVTAGALGVMIGELKDVAASCATTSRFRVGVPVVAYGDYRAATRPAPG